MHSSSRIYLKSSETFMKGEIILCTCVKKEIKWFVIDRQGIKCNFIGLPNMCLLSFKFHVI